MTDEIPEDIRGFVMKHIDSVAQLEALLLLRANPVDRWGVTAVAQRLYIADAEAAALLNYLEVAGLVRCKESRFWYECAAPELAEAVARLAEHYSRQLIPITNLIHSKPRRIRQFADAFKFRKGS